MKFTRSKLICLLVFYMAANVAAAPGNPIGGIIVKGGRNPGGQMLVLATTDSKGQFKVRFADGGEYRLEFEQTARKTERQSPAHLRLEYLVTASSGDTANHRVQPSGRSQITHFANDFKNARLLVNVPKGGAGLTGSFQSIGGTGADPAAAKAIGESGVSVKSPKVKGGAKP